MKTSRPLWAHQAEAIKRAEELPHFGLFFSPGLGKTRTVIGILRAKYRAEGRLLRTLIFCPPIVIDNWRREWLEYSAVPGTHITGLTGTGKSRLNTLVGSGFENGKPLPQIFILNYECLQMDDLFEKLLEWRPEAIVFDELHRLKDYKRTAVRAQRANRLANPSSKKSPGPRPLVYGLTGTPYPNSLMDIFMQYKLIDGGIAFGQNFTEFRLRYFRDKNAGMPKARYFPNWVPIGGAEEEMAKRMAASSIRAKLEDCLDLPPVIEKTIAVEMTKEQARLYKAMKEELVAYFERGGEEKATVATMALTRGLRLMQIASGYVKDDEGVESATDEWTPKQEALKQILENLQGHKVIVWAVWKHNYEQIREVFRRLNMTWLEMNGEQGAQKNRDAAAEFESSDEYDGMIAHPESGGEGVNLVSASYRVSFSRNFSWRQMKQSDARNYRGGSERHASITRLNLVTKNTIEEIITEKLAKHEEITESVLREITLSLKANQHE